MEPKSGCKKINKIGIKNTAASLTQNLMLSLIFPILLRANIEAAIMDVLKQAIVQKEGEEEYVPDVVDLNTVKPATSDKCSC